MSGRRAVFLDRDGTVNVEVGYIRNHLEINLIAGAGEAIRDFNQSGWLVIVVTNQSGVSRGYLPSDELERAHNRLRQLVEAVGGRIDAIYHCPHLPADGCRCRKPALELIERAVAEFEIDLAASWMVGDKDTDLELGRNAGCRTALVKTGYGLETLAELKAGLADLIAEDLPEAAGWIQSENAVGTTPA